MSDVWTAGPSLYVILCGLGLPWLSIRTFLVVELEALGVSANDRRYQSPPSTRPVKPCGPVEEDDAGVQRRLNCAKRASNLERAIAAVQTVDDRDAGNHSGGRKRTFRHVDGQRHRVVSRVQALQRGTRECDRAVVIEMRGLRAVDEEIEGVSVACGVKPMLPLKTALAPSATATSAHRCRCQWAYREGRSRTPL